MEYVYVRNEALLILCLTRWRSNIWTSTPCLTECRAVQHVYIYIVQQVVLTTCAAYASYSVLPVVIEVDELSKT